MIPDIKVGLSGSSSSSAGINSPFSVTGGGGSSAASTGAYSPISGTGTPSGVAAWLPWAVAGLVGIVLVVVLSKRKRKR